MNPSVDTVGHGAREQRAWDPGNGARESHQSEVQRRELRDTVSLRDLHDEQSQREDLHPPADVRDEQSCPDQSEVADA